MQNESTLCLYFKELFNLSDRVSFITCWSQIYNTNIRNFFRIYKSFFKNFFNFFGGGECTLTSDFGVSAGDLCQLPNPYSTYLSNSLQIYETFFIYPSLFNFFLLNILGYPANVCLDYSAFLLLFNNTNIRNFFHISKSFFKNFLVAGDRIELSQTWLMRPVGKPTSSPRFMMCQESFFLNV